MNARGQPYGAEPGPPGPGSPQRPGRLPRRPSDRIQAFLDAVIALLLIAGLATVPLTAGTAAYSFQARLSRTQSAERHQVTARLTTDARGVPQRASAGGSDRQSALVSWTDDSGRTVTGRANVPTSARKGSEVRIWVDRAGSVTDPPVARESAMATALLTGFLTAFALTGAALGTRRVLIVALDHRRYRQWEAEWQQIEPTWTGRAH